MPLPILNLEALKADLNQFKGERTVAAWNTLREAVKKTYSLATIIQLDASGYISTWLKG